MRCGKNIFCFLFEEKREPRGQAVGLSAEFFGLSTKKTPVFAGVFLVCGTADRGLRIRAKFFEHEPRPRKKRLKNGYSLRACGLID